VKTAWPEVAFLEAFEDATRGHTKTKQRDYLPVGRIPIVDQGKELIGGYTDNEAAVSHVELPVIVFGDHTRCIKFVDFEFGPGADGVKILKPRDGIDPRYAYHCVRTVQIPDGGYSRHFKFLKETRIPLPPIDEQRRIAAVLDRADAVRAKRRQAVTAYHTLSQAIFVDMFGDPRLGTSVPLADHVEIVTKGTTPTSVGFDFADSGVPFVRVQDLVGGTVDVDAIELFISDETHRALRRSILKPADVLVSIAGTIGRIAVVPKDAPEMNCNQAIALVRTAPGLVPEYLQAWMNTGHAQQQMIGSRVTGTISNLSLTRIRDLRLPVPQLTEQRDFAARIAQLNQVVGKASAHMTGLASLFSSLQQRAFRGDL